MNFTKGPWRHVPWHIEEGDPTVRAPAGWIIASVHSDANARLIAAAPELLAVARKALDAWTGDGPPIDLDELRAAIAKAGAA